MKFLFFSTLFVLSLFGFPMNSLAQEDFTNTLIYDLSSSTNSKEVIFVDTEGEEITISIELLDPMSKISQGTYKITKKSAGLWDVSYNVTINSTEQFTAANNLKVTALSGSILSNSLTNTSTKATCIFKHKIGLVTSNPSVISTISNGKLIVK